MIRTYFFQLKKNWIFDIIMALVFAASVIIMSMYMDMFYFAKEIKRIDYPKNYDCVRGIVNGKGTFEDYISSLNLDQELEFGYNGKLSFTQFGKAGTVINSAMAKHSQVKTKNGKWFSEKFDENCLEIIINKSEKENYKIGETYGFEDKAFGKINVKIIDYLYSDYSISNSGTNIFIGKNSYFIVCSDKLTSINISYADGIRFGGVVSVYGNSSKDSSEKIFGEDNYWRENYKEHYKESVDTSRDALFMVVLIELLLIIIMGTNTLITIRVSNKRNAVNYLCGSTNAQIIGAEILRMIIGIILPIVINIALFPLMKPSGLYRFIPFMISLSLVTVSYLIGIIARIIKVVKMDNLAVLRGVI